MEPLATSRKRRYSANDVQYLNENELEALLSVVRASGSARDLAIFEVASHRGTRAGEIRLFQLADFNPAARTLFVHRLKKSNSGEYVITDREHAALTTYLAERGWSPGPLFLSRKGKGVGRSRLHDMINAYGAACGLIEAKRHFHCMRHTAGTLALDHADVVDVQDLLGHRDIRSTMVYAKVRNKRRMDLGRRMAKEW